MKIKLKKDIYGYNSGVKTRKHSDKGDSLQVVLMGDGYFICDSKHHPGSHIIVFPSDVNEIINEPKTLEELEFEEELEYGTISEQTN